MRPVLRFRVQVMLQVRSQSATRGTVESARTAKTPARAARADSSASGHMCPCAPSRVPVPRCSGIASLERPHTTAPLWRRRAAVPWPGDVLRLHGDLGLTHSAWPT